MSALDALKPAKAPNPPEPSGEEADGPASDLFSSWSEIPSRVAHLASERAAAESELRAIFEAKLRRADATLDQATGEADRRRDREAEEAANHVATERAAARTNFEQETGDDEAELAALRKKAVVRYRRDLDDAEKKLQATRWEAGTIFEAADSGAAEWRKERADHLAGETEAFEVLKGERDYFRAKYRGFLPRPSTANSGEPTSDLGGADPFPALRSAIEDADAKTLAIDALKLPNAFHGPRIAWVFLLPMLALAYPAWWLLGNIAGPIAAVVLGLAIGFGLRVWIVKASRSRLALFGPLERGLVAVARRIAEAEKYIVTTFDQRVSDATLRRNKEWNRAETLKEMSLTEATTRRDEKIRDAEAAAEAKRADAVIRRDRRLRSADETEHRRAVEIASQHQADHAEAKRTHEHARSEAESRRAKSWEAAAEAWSSGFDGVTATVSDIRSAIDARFPDWSDSDSWSPMAGLPAAVKFGELALDLDRVEHGLSRDPEMRSLTPDGLAVPALAGFPEHTSLAFEFAGDAGRKASIDGMQAAMLRFLTGLPPGKVRLTMLDPVGLGRSFAGFMHLADYAEALVNTRIWTEAQQIDARLGELNGHVETVIQTYLRNEFPTIESYNEQAAEVAEPYRVLVVPDFPTGFNEATARRLLAIAKSGPRCGVYVLLGIDPTQELPPSITREELLRSFVRLSWRDGQFVMRGSPWQPFRLTIDPLPDGETMTRLVHRVGRAAKAANRVEVPFEVIAPRPEDYWKADSRSEVVVPLGRSGATRLQSLHLGKGTSQHALIAGRTGSGKSTLLHALITNSALIYSPDELELYLIDFKKGVEFKTYATHRLPHARVIAVESEREFGISVLQRLDSELKARGDLYRDLGVQDVAGFRAARPNQPMPRILLIVDEFQEFFVEDDKLAQEASLLLDRLVRQGRAFGVHVHLGSQTLGGAYSLARSTLGQMAIRIALQCSEADAHLILNEDNSAARLLSRPGEAIYNDANGQTEGNHTFQVVWLPDACREQYLKAVAELARERHVPDRPQIVFEGNKPADLAALAILNSPREVRTGVFHAWLGEAIAIKDPTVAAFRAQGGKNMLILGQNADMAAGILHAMIRGLAAQLPDESNLLLLDGTPDDSGLAGVLERSLVGIPQHSQAGSTREAAAMLGEAAAEVERRQGGSGASAPWFVFVVDLPRFRDLRKTDDDFSFSSRRGEEKAVSAAKLLGTILREGPALGVHAVVWCDSLNNANRAFDRAALREFEMRVLFQMSAGDSSNLIDSPAASRMGANRAFFASEEEGKLEKFRPYGLPSTS